MHYIEFMYISYRVPPHISLLEHLVQLCNAVASGRRNVLYNETNKFANMRTGAFSKLTYFYNLAADIS